MDTREPGWVYIALDVEASNFGDALSELNRTGWKITRSEQLTSDEPPANPERAWHRLYAKKQIDSFADLFGA